MHSVLPSAAAVAVAVAAQYCIWKRRRRRIRKGTWGIWICDSASKSIVKYLKASWSVANTVCSSAVQCDAVCCSVLQCATVCCSALQCAALRCSVLQCAAVCCSALQCAAVRCSVLQCAAVCCSALQCAGDPQRPSFLLHSLAFYCILFDFGCVVSNLIIYITCAATRESQ